MKFLFHSLHISQNGPAIASTLSKLSFIRVYHSLGKSSTNALIFLLSLAVCRLLPPFPQSLPLKRINFYSFKVHSSYLICPSQSLLSSPDIFLNFTKYYLAHDFQLTQFHKITQITPHLTTSTLDRVVGNPWGLQQGILMSYWGQLIMKP